MKLTSSERTAIFAGDFTALKRPVKPQVETGTTLVLSWSRGGKQIVDRGTGETITIPRKPTVWIKFTKPPYLKDGRWVAEFSGHDDREPTRLLSSAPSGISRQAGLRTRQRPPAQVPKKGTETAHFTTESERGYSGSGRTAIDPAEGVDDDTLRGFALKARSDRGEFQRELEGEEKQMSEEARRKRARAALVRLKETLAGLDHDSQLALLAAVEQDCEKAKLLKAA